MCVYCANSSCSLCFPEVSCIGAFLACIPCIAIRQAKFPLDPASFRVAAGRACGLFLSVDFVRDWVYYDLNDLNATVVGRAAIHGRG